MKLVRQLLLRISLGKLSGTRKLNHGLYSEINDVI